MRSSQRVTWLLPAVFLAACSSDPPSGNSGKDTGVDDDAMVQPDVKDTDSSTTPDVQPPQDTVVVDDNPAPVDTGDDVMVTPDADTDSSVTPDSTIDGTVTPDADTDSAVTPDADTDSAVTPDSTIDSTVTPDADTDSAVTPDAGTDSAVTPDADTDSAVPADVLTCMTGQSLCGSTCADTQTDNANCGSCGRTCSAGQTCRGGACVTPCPTGQTTCSGVCVNTQSDIANCGSCGNACPSGQMCVSGVCDIVCTSPQTICTAASGSRTCVNLQSDTANCGACGNACATGLSCVSGVCQLVCPAGQTNCGGTCVDLTSSGTNCGACGNACATGQTCAAGRCIRTCNTAAGETLCGDACVNLQTSGANCGRCGNACPTGQSCVAGACTCGTGLTLCGSSCLDTQTDSANCGRCGNACPTGQNCAAGTCRSTAPANDLPAGAVVINLTSPSQTLTGTTVGSANNSSCGSGGDVYYRFTLAAREVVYADTFGSSYDTALAFAPSSGTGTISGTCTDDSCSGRQEQVARVLDAGTYYLVVSGFATTGTFTLHFQHLPVGSGAVNQITSIAAGSQSFTGTTTGTGILAQSCTAAPGPEVTYWFTTCEGSTATAYTASTCGTATWDTVLEQRSAARTPLAVCNDDACSLQSTISGTIAAGAGLHTLYVDGFGATSAGPYTLNVRFGSCATGQNLCGTACVNLQTDTANCGACGTACATGLVCTAGVCACATGTTLCSGRCVNTLTDTANCGACGTACGAGLVCTAGRCVCPAGQNLCGGRCVTLTTDASNCGACGTVCPSGAACTAGACVCSAGLTACGSTCVNLTSSNTNCGACGRTCLTGTTCSTSVCRPTNDSRASATVLTLGVGETTVAGTTANASVDSPTPSCGAATTSPNVWYRVTLTQRELLYVDLAGSSYDTVAYLVSSTGAEVANTCNDDSGCSTTTFTAVQSRTAAVLAAGTYYIGVSGFNGASGFFTMHVQHLPAVGSRFFDAAISGTAVTASSTLTGTSAYTPACTAGPSGEDVRWFMACGTTTASLFSMCRSDNASATYVRASGATTYDPSMAVRSGSTGAEIGCNDDGSATDCQGTGGDTANYGSRISVAVPRGVATVINDERARANGMTYRMFYNIQ